jgi:GT2 family glycosyltransferase
MKISISVLTYNRGSILKDLLVSLSSIKYEQLEIIVIDNCSKDNTSMIMSKEFPQILYIKLSQNIGASARNVGLQKATGDIIITLDDDIIGINDDAIFSILTQFVERPRLGAVNFSVTDYYTGKICNWVHHRNISENFDKEFLTYEITEGAVAFRRRALEVAGYYPTYFFLSHEGPDLALRLIDSGYDVIYSNKISVLHKHSDLGRRPWMNYYYDTRNQVWYAIRNLPAFYAISYLFRGLSSMLIYSIRDGYIIWWLKAIRDSFKGIIRAFGDRRVISKKTLSIIRNIDNHRPSIFYMLKKRFFVKGVRL